MRSTGSDDRTVSLDYATPGTPRGNARDAGPERGAIVWCCTALFLIGGGYYWYDTHRVTACGSPANRMVTYNTLNHFVFSLDEFYKEYGYYPQGGNPTVVATLRGKDYAGEPTRKNPFYVQNPPRRPPVVDRWGRLCDDWGHPFIVQGGGGATRPTVYSIGANGVDEQGGGDDVLPDPALTPQTAPVPVPSPSTTPSNG
jgi:hypothetical protein